MPSSILLLLGQALATFAASFGVGYLPIAFKTISGKRLNAISVFGMGLLVGAALTIIIPEGVETLYGSLPENDDEAGGPTHVIGIALLGGFALMMLVESLTPHATAEDHDQEHHHHHSNAQNGHYERVSRTPSPLEPGSPTSARYSLRPTPSAMSSPRQGAERMDSSTALFPSKKLTRRPSDTDSDLERAAQSKKKDGVAGLNATLGLVIHAMADGIALGASSLSERDGLGLVVFLAVIVHKGPTALGLTTTLLSLGLTPIQIRTRLFIFSISAPIGAVLTYALVKLFGGSGSAVGAGSIDGIMWWTGAVLLFSGGSFLYVATVISPLSDADSHNTHAHAHHHDPEDQKLTKTLRLILLMAGMGLPLVLSAVIGGHGH